MFSHIYTALFGPMACRVVSARTKAEAIRLVGSERPDLILMDLRLPDSSGVDAIRAIRAMPGFATKPIIVVSAHAVGQGAEEARAAGCTEMLAKPISVEELTAITSRHLSAAAN